MANIRDIANLAGVSVTTVSRVLNNHPYVSDEKRRAVLNAIQKTNYQINMKAVHLSKGKSRLIGVVVPFANNPYFGLLVEGITKMAYQHQYHIVLIQTNYEKERELEALNMLKHKQIDGIIICSRILDWNTIKPYAGYGPLVVCEKATDIDYVQSVYVDHYQSFTSALHYLYDKGHRQIGYCIGRETGSNSYYRAKAYQNFLKEKDLPFLDEFVFTENYYFEDGKKVVKMIISQSNAPSALLASDVVAAGILTACQHNGIAVPDDLAIIGFDNQPIAKVMNITTFEIPIVEMGEKLFLQVIEKRENKHEKLEVTLIERNTV
ncbi:LacI family DNA-binding transcriptional regulator [Gracilibacillus dipsosauri]|uniref:LacI family DNA-binding transcriptional regulator n=1 Tax=Gracilibacillus dipsosauri TaxID=178340 RepID=UPI002408FF3A